VDKNGEVTGASLASLGKWRLKWRWSFTRLIMLGWFLLTVQVKKFLWDIPCTVCILLCTCINVRFL